MHYVHIRSLYSALTLLVCATLCASSAVAAPSLAFQVHLPLVGTSALSPTPDDVASSQLVIDSQGDVIGQGRSFTYTAQDATFTAHQLQQGYVLIGVNAANGDGWNIILAAPTGQDLRPGTYEGAVRAINRDWQTPGLDVSANNLGCNIVEGRFVIKDVRFGPYDYVERLVATFEQRCPEGGNIFPLFGEIRIVNPPPQPQIDVTLVIDPRGTVDAATGAATISGSVSCSRSAQAERGGYVTQGETVAGSAGSMFTCSPTPTPWSITVGGNDERFTPGAARLSTIVFINDPVYNVRFYKEVEKEILLEAAP